jgi:GxxExxY protein
MQDEELTGKIIGYAIKVHKALGPGFLESVYKNALAHELRNAGINFEMEKPLKVLYEGTVVGDFFADMLVENRLLLELKANQSLVTANEVQLVNYLSATGIETGLLLNFGGERLDFKRKSKTYRPATIPKILSILFILSNFPVIQ